MKAHALYRFFDKDDNLLYVGITLNPGHRWISHRDKKPWWQQVARISLETYPDRASVLAAELLAIQTEQPAHNIQHKSKTTPTPSVELHWRTGLPWTAAEMPDYCRYCGNRLAIYAPFRWENGLATYACQYHHEWTCHWSYHGTGENEENAGRLLLERNINESAERNTNV